jgi:hypothetical protein
MDEPHPGVIVSLTLGQLGGLPQREATSFSELLLRVMVRLCLCQDQRRRSRRGVFLLIEANRHSAVVVAGVCITTSLSCLSSIKRVFVGIEITVDQHYFAVRQRNLFCEKALRHTTADNAIHVNRLSFSIGHVTGAFIQRLKAETAVRRSYQQSHCKHPQFHRFNLALRLALPMRWCAVGTLA